MPIDAQMPIDTSEYGKKHTILSTLVNKVVTVKENK